VTSDAHHRAKALFLAACELPTGERGAFLDEACGDDRALREEVEGLLLFDREGETVAPPGPPSPGDIPGYRLLQKLGEGGMGEVWEAEQEGPVRRRVALKLVKWGMDTRQVVARFESERQALALMSHPTIARVFDAGATTDGRPFFAMELVKGVPITDYCDGNRVSTRERLQLFIQVCEGIQHAHQKGVIHRDVKPSNVLVTVQDGKPAPKIIDFGVAKATAQRLTERTLFTELGQWIGTPEYMSPEQADLGSLDVDTRTDVYSLGVLLYELLAGAQPFDPGELRRSGFDEMRRRIREVDPPRPSTRVSSLGEASTDIADRRRTDPGGLVRLLRGDLDWIVMKALEKDRTRRYASPSELASDLDRHLHDQPVLAGAPSAAYRLGKFARRHRVGVATAAVVLVTLVAGIAGTTVGLVRARREARSARQVSDLLVGMFEVMDPMSSWGIPFSVEDLLGRGVDRIEAELGDQPLVEARLLDTMGRVYLNLGHTGQAEPLLDRALALRREHLGELDPRVADSLDSLGWLAIQQGTYEPARQRFESALRIRLDSLGEGAVAVGLTHSNLSFTSTRLGDHASAWQHSDRALQILEAGLGPDAPAVADALYFRQVILHNELRYREALAVCQRVLRIRKRSYGEAHSGLGWALHDLGLLHEHLGELGPARAEYERSLAAFTRSAGPDNWATSYPLEKLAGLDSVAGDYATADTRFEAALAMREAALGPAHPELAPLLRNYSRHLLRRGEPERARAVLERAVEITRLSLGPSHAEYARCLGALGWYHYATGDLATARSLFERDFEILRRLFGPGHKTLGTPLYNLACLAALGGEREQALDLLEEAVTTGWAAPVILDDPDLESLRGDPRLEAAVTEVKRRLEER